MDQRIKELILKNLSLYNQGFARLRGTKKGKDCYCFGGVLCDLYMKDQNDGHWENNISGYEFVINNAAYSHAIPIKVLTWAFPDYWFLKPKIRGFSLIQANDFLGLTFSQFAKELKEHF